MSTQKDETYLSHLPLPEFPPGNLPLVAPVHLSVKYEFASYADLEANRLAGKPGYFYSRVSNPTVRQLEIALAHLQKREECLAVASGVGALSAVFFALLKSGDHVCLFLESYPPTRYLVQGLLAKFGVRSTLLSIRDLDAFEKTVDAERSRMVVFESPTNPMLRIADIERITRAAKRAGALTVLDNTFAGFHQHSEFPIDLYIHSLTKFASGHGDVMGGAVIGPRALIEEIRKDSINLGAVLDPQAAYFILRGLKTYVIRYRAQSESAEKVARFLENHPRARDVQYPGLEFHPEHRLAKKQMPASFGTLVTFTLESRGLPEFLDRLEIFKRVASLGSSDSLATPAKLFFAQALDPKLIEASGIRENTVRLSIGLEHSDDLIHDLEQALG